MDKLRPEALATAAAWILICACFLLTVKTGEQREPDTIRRAFISEETRNYGSENLTVDISMPVISGIGDRDFEAGLNFMIRKQVSEALRDAESAADEFWSDARRSGYEPWPYTFYAEYTVKSAEGILSLKVTTFMYTGGPGMPETECYNVDIEKSRLIRLSDLFKNDSYKTSVNDVIESEMAKTPDRYLGDEPFKGVSDETKFFISEGKLFITFAKYEVASGMTGEPEFLIPSDVIRRALKTEYKNIIK